MKNDELRTRESVTLTDLKRVAQARIREFHALKEKKLYAGAIYMGRVAVEVYLKCLICRRLNKKGLPELFHSHDLGGLLYYAGLREELKLPRNNKRQQSFESINGQVLNALRYQNPGKVKLSHCNDWNRWLNDRSEGLIPWLQKKLR